MTGRWTVLILCGFAAVGSGCATKRFVQEQVTATEAKLDQRVDVQETKLREAADLARTAREAIDAADHQLKDQLKGLDARVGDVGVVASAATARADSVALAAQDAEARLSQRIAGRNRYRLLETRSIYFDAGRAEIRTQDLNQLEQMAKALAEDSNAVLELQGFADPRGSDRYNDELSRARVEAVVRQLVQRHGIELRRLHSASMGKAALGTGEKPDAEAFANARRVDIRLLAPWSSWEDTKVGMDDPSADAGAASPTTTEVSPPGRGVVPRGERHGEQPTHHGADKALREILNTITKEDLGGRD